MALRLALDLDGTLADLSTAYHQLGRRLHRGDPAAPAARTGDAAFLPATPDEAPPGDPDAAIWQAIHDTEDFWLSLAPLEPGVVRRLYDVSRTRGWEVFFVTQRPATAGATVQYQTQQWLVRQGFEFPSVLTLPGSRGRAAAALSLDVLIDDLPKNCVDVAADSSCQPILVLRESDPDAEAAAKRTRVSIVRSVGEALDALESAATAGPQEGFVQRALRRFGLA